MVAKKGKKEKRLRNPAAENEERNLQRAATAPHSSGLHHLHNLVRRPEVGVFFFFKVHHYFIKFVGVTLVNTIYMFQVYHSITHHPCIRLCIYHPKSSFFHSPYT